MLTVVSVKRRMASQRSQGGGAVGSTRPWRTYDPDHVGQAAPFSLDEEPTLVMNHENEETIWLVLDHPHGEVEVSMSEWMSVGPGERSCVRPTEAYQGRDRRRVSLTVLPLRFRNSRLSKMLISLGVLEDPWGS